MKDFLFDLIVKRISTFKLVRVCRWLLSGTGWEVKLRGSSNAGLNSYQYLCHKASVDAGWWHDVNTGAPLQRNKGELIAQIHSEISEALEGARKNCMDDKLPYRRQEEVELADALIRIFDYAGAGELHGGFSLDLEGALREKMAYNAQRADHKPENRRKSDGKKF